MYDSIVLPQLLYYCTSKVATIIRIYCQWPSNNWNNVVKECFHSRHLICLLSSHYPKKSGKVINDTKNIDISCCLTWWIDRSHKIHPDHVHRLELYNRSNFSNLLNFSDSLTGFARRYPTPNIVCS